MTSRNTVPLFVGARTRSATEKVYVTLPSDATLLQMAEDALTLPEDSFWADEQMFDTHTQMFATPDPDLTDEYDLGWSNYRSVYRDLHDAWPRYEAATESTFRHWTYSRYLAIKVRVRYTNGEIHPAFAAACAIALNLQQQGVYDDDDYNEIGNERQAVLDRETLDELRGRALTEHEELSPEDREQWAQDVMRHLWGYGSSYRGEGWQDDEIADAIEFADSQIGTVRPDGSFQSLF